jgi:hypothetical protein
MKGMSPRSMVRKTYGRSKPSYHKRAKRPTTGPERAAEAVVITVKCVTYLFALFLFVLFLMAA